MPRMTRPLSTDLAPLRRMTQCLNDLYDATLPTLKEITDRGGNQLEATVISMGKNWKHWLWRAVESNGKILDILAKSHRNVRDVKHSIFRLIGCWGKPRAIVRDKLGG